MFKGNCLKLLFPGWWSLGLLIAFCQTKAVGSLGKRKWMKWLIWYSALCFPLALLLGER